MVRHIQTKILQMCVLAESRIKKIIKLFCILMNSSFGNNVFIQILTLVEFKENKNQYHAQNNLVTPI